MIRPESGGWIAWFAHNPVAANLLMLTILVVGAVTLWGIRTEGFPEPPPNVVTVDVEFDGGSPEEIEEGVVVKMENSLDGLDGIYRIRSRITGDGASISIFAVDGYPVRLLKDNVKARIDAIASLPDAVERVVISEAQGERDVISVQLYGDASHATLKAAAKRVRDRLLALAEGNLVSIHGVRPAEVSIEVREEKLRAYGLTFGEVAAAVQAASINLRAGKLRTDSGTVTLQARQQRYHGHELEVIVVRSSAEGGLVRLRDIATVRDAWSEQPVLSTFQGYPSINLVVQLLGRDSVLEASAAVQQAVEDIRLEGWLPETVRLVTWADEAENVRDSIGLLATSACLGMVLVLILLTLFLHPGVALWVAVGVPVSFAGALIVMGPVFFDYSINDLTVFAFMVSLGIVVDDAIIIGESIYTHKRRSGGGVETAVRGAKEVAVPATFGVLTTIAAFYPLTTISGNFGGPFRMIAVVTIACLLFSLVESKLVLPAHLAVLRLDNDDVRSSHGLGRAWHRFRGWIDRGLDAFIHGVYRRTMELTVRFRYQALCVLLAILVAAVGLVSAGVVRVVFFGADNSTLVHAHVKLAPGTSARTTHQVAAFVERQAYDVGKKLAGKYRLARSPVHNVHVLSTVDEEATVSVQISPGTHRPFESQEFLAAWRRHVGTMPAARELSFYIDDPESDDLRIELSSPDPATSRAAMNMVKQHVETYAGLRDIQTNADNGVPDVTVSLRAGAELLGLRTRDVITQLRHAMEGFEAQKIQRGDEEVRVKVRYPQDARDELRDLQHTRIRTEAGGTVALEQVAHLHWSDRPAELIRIDGNRVLTLAAHIDKDRLSPSDLAETIEETLFPKIVAAYPSVTIELAGEAEAAEQAMAELASAFVLGMLLIYALLAIPLRSYTAPFVILLAVPFGVVGAILGHLVVGIPISFLSLFGMLALSGVVVNDSLVLISRHNARRAQGAGFLEAVVDAGTSRFRAVLLTSVTTFAGLLPLVAERSEQAMELIPMAVSLSFGILFATVISLLIVPCLLGIRSDVEMLLPNKLSKQAEA